MRTTNVIDRVNKEFKWRTKPMEIVVGERSCYTLLDFVSLKIELRWRSKPIGKAPNNLPSLKKLSEIVTHKIIDSTGNSFTYEKSEEKIHNINL